MISEPIKRSRPISGEFNELSAPAEFSGFRSFVAPSISFFFPPPTPRVFPSCQLSFPTEWTSPLRLWAYILTNPHLRMPFDEQGRRRSTRVPPPPPPLSMSDSRKRPSTDKPKAPPKKKAKVSARYVIFLLALLGRYLTSGLFGLAPRRRRLVTRRPPRETMRDQQRVDPSLDPSRS